MDLTNQADQGWSLFLILYVIALIVSIFGVFLSSKLRHDRAVERFKRNVAMAKRDPSSIWPYHETEEE